MKCPRCDGAELATRTLKGGGAELDQCTQCKGVWFDEGELPEVLGAPGPSPRVPPRAKRRDMACPRCGEPLYTCCYPGTVVLVERCKACAGTWLDDREINHIHAARASARAAAQRRAALIAKANAAPGRAAPVAPSGATAQPAAAQPMMRCPKCTQIVARGDECAHCGVIVEKYLAAETRRRDRERRLDEEYPQGRGVKGSLLRFVNGTIERFTGWDFSSD